MVVSSITRLAGASPGQKKTAYLYRHFFVILDYIIYYKSREGISQMTIQPCALIECLIALGGVGIIILFIITMGVSVGSHIFTFFCSLKMECEKLAQEKTEMQRHYVMVSIWVSRSPYPLYL